MLYHLFQSKKKFIKLTKLLPLAYWWVFIKAHFVTAKEAVLVVDRHTVVVVWVVWVAWDAMLKEIEMEALDPMYIKEI